MAVWFCFDAALCETVVPMRVFAVSSAHTAEVVCVSVVSARCLSPGMPTDAQLHQWPCTMGWRLQSPVAAATASTSTGRHTSTRASARPGACRRATTHPWTSLAASCRTRRRHRHSEARYCSHLKPYSRSRLIKNFCAACSHELTRLLTCLRAQNLLGHRNVAYCAVAPRLRAQA